MNIRELQRQLGIRRQEDMLALTKGNDPFLKAPARIKRAEWAKMMFDRFYIDGPLHLRGLHYRMLGLEIEIPWGDRFYENTQKDWTSLGSAFRDARRWGHVPYSGIEDRKNAEALIEDSFIGWAGTKYRPGVESEDALFEMPAPEYVTFKSGHSLPYLIEIWSEKYERVIGDIAERYRCNLQILGGTSSLTRNRELLMRIVGASKPAVIFYLSDFDPKGKEMPRSVSRDLEFAIRDEGLDVDVQLEHLMLTRDQVLEYDLPGTPITTRHVKIAVPSDITKWNDEMGGQVEITALIARHPEAFEEILVNAIKPFVWNPSRDHELEQEWEDKFDALMLELVDDFDAIQVGVSGLVNEHIKLCQRVQKELDDSFDAYRSECVVRAKLSDPLYDSSREYMVQIAKYKLAYPPTKRGSP